MSVLFHWPPYNSHLRGVPSFDILLISIDKRYTFVADVLMYFFVDVDVFPNISPAAILI